MRTLSAQTGTSPEAVRRNGRWLRVFVMALLAVGFCSRIAPLFDQGGRRLRQFPTEDGYLMLTIARNISLGHGMSVSEGTVPTNGTQPLITFLWAGCFSLAGGAKEVGVLLVLVSSVLISVLAAWWLYKLGRELLGDAPDAGPIAAVAASAWFASHLIVSHTMNCLETGAYTLVVLGCVRLVVRWSGDGKGVWSVGRCAMLGLVLGAAFWTRNDAVFLVTAVCLTRVATGLGRGWPALRRRLVETFIAGAVSVLVALPWLLNNVLRFGHLMPISGIAESTGNLGVSLHLVPVKLAEYLGVVIGIPSALEGRPPVCAASTFVVLGAAGLLVAAWRRSTPSARTALVLVGAYAFCLSAYYGIIFGATYFLSRFLMPISPFLALWTAVLAAAVLRWLFRIGWGRVVVPMGAAVLAAALFFNIHLYLHGSKHMHFQVKDWVEKNVADDVWIGAVQTGTLGFFHDRALNLDGKVSPIALEALLKGRIPYYVVDSPIQYLADWVGIAGWATIPPIRDHFDLIVKDEEANLAVLRRRM